MRPSLLVVVAVLLWPIAAHAELTSRVGLDGGGGEVGDRALRWLGIGIGFERRIGGAAIGVEAGYAGVMDSIVDDPWTGRMVRAAGTMRWLLGDAGADALAMDAWLDLGVGGHAIEWGDGGVLYRPELLVGVTGKLGPDFGGGRFGDFVSLHLLLTRGPGCAAGCADELQLGIHVTTGLFFTD